MARKVKQGLDYFPHDCNLDDKLEYLIAEHSEKGYYVYFRLLEKIYSENGYYMKADKKTLVLYSNKINVDIEFLYEVFEFLITENLFSKQMFEEHEILTSKGVQDRYIEAILRRKEIYLIKDYLLINVEDVVNNKKNVIINMLNVDKSTQSKVEYSKVDNIKVNQSKVKHGFKESQYFDFNLFKKEIGEIFHKYDLKYYHDKMIVHQDKYEYADWLEAGKNWILNDVKENKAVLKKAIQTNEPKDTRVIDEAKTFWNKVMMDVSKNITRDEYENYLDLIIMRFEESFLIVKASNKLIIEKLDLELLNNLVQKYFGEITFKIVTKTN